MPLVNHSESLGRYTRFDVFNASTLYEAAGKTGDMAPAIRALSVGTRVLGRAFTVRCWQGDGSAFTRAVDLALAGDVLVIDSGAGEAATCWGGTATSVAIRRKIAGVITNGSVRDVQEIRASKFPVFCAGSSVRGGVRHGAGELSIAVSVGNVVVTPGDLVVGDDDGVVVIPERLLENVFLAAVIRKRYEDEIARRVNAGDSYSTVTATEE
jgi:4-hydroxy-4-methyl-2-oxoglutarate aldolase